MRDFLESSRAPVAELCRRFGVQRLDVFGSVQTEAFNAEQSDLDFLAEFNADSSLLFDRYFGLKEGLEAVFGRKVDLVTAGRLGTRTSSRPSTRRARRSMQPKTPKLLEDIRDAAAFIREAVAGKTLADYQRDRLLRQAIERNFEIIGEAMNQLAQSDAPVADRISKSRRIIDFRNVLIHGHDLIDHRIVWSTIEEELPLLLAEVGRLLEGSR